MTEVEIIEMFRKAHEIGYYHPIVKYRRSLVDGLYDGPLVSSYNTLVQLKPTKQTVFDIIHIEDTHNKITSVEFVSVYRKGAWIREFRAGLEEEIIKRREERKLIEKKSHMDIDDAWMFETKKKGWLRHLLGL